MSESLFPIEIMKKFPQCDVAEVWGLGVTKTAYAQKALPYTQVDQVEMVAGPAKARTKGVRLKTF